MGTHDTPFFGKKGLSKGSFFSRLRARKRGNNRGQATFAFPTFKKGDLIKNSKALSSLLPFGGVFSSPFLFGICG